MSLSLRLKRILVLITGWLFLFLGVAGLFLPVLQGVLFILVGLIILSSEYVWAHHLLNRLKQRFPKVARLAEQASAKANSWVHRFSSNRKPD